MTTQHSSAYRSPFLRRMSLLDKVLSEVGRAVQILDGSVHATRPNPAGKAAPSAAQDESDVMSRAEQAHAAGLMRVNHVEKFAHRPCTGARRHFAATHQFRKYSGRPPRKRSTIWSGAARG